MLCSAPYFPAALLILRLLLSFNPYFISRISVLVVRASAPASGGGALPLPLVTSYLGNFVRPHCFMTRRCHADTHVVLDM